MRHVTDTDHRQLTLLDRVVTHLDQALRVTFAPAPAPERASPAKGLGSGPLDGRERKHAAGLMRINHTGEVCAQALYAGQAATARDTDTRDRMAEAAREEEDHLAWCAQRLEALDSRPSLSNPFWYAGSFTLGALAGAAGDPWSLGFVEATEHQVEAHLDDHLRSLPENDHQSRAVVAQMKEDEARHAEMAATAGARRLPAPVQRLMGVLAGTMKRISYRI